MSTTKRVVAHTEHVTLCDFCQKPTKKRCAMCHRDVCGLCSVYDEDDWTDYPERYCRPCWERPEREAYYAHKAQADLRDEELRAAWKAACQP